MQKNTPGAIIKAARTGREWTQAQLAEEMTRYGEPISTAFVSYLESGERMPSVPVARALSVVLDVSLDTMFAGVEPTP